MKIYIAGPSKEVQRIVGMRATLRQAGHVVTSRWIDIVLTEHAGGRIDADVSRDKLLECAQMNIEDIHESDMLVYAPPQRAGGKSEGAAWELGYAMGQRRRVVLNYDGVKTPIVLFGLLVPSVNGTQELLSYLRGLA